MAELAERLMDDLELAAGSARPEQLFERFNRDFWSDDRGGYYVVGLDGDKQPIDSMTSNMGHLLWSGIVPEDRARTVADHLLSDMMFSGWGVRTISREDRGYNPIGYHVGTIWPHDNAIVARVWSATGSATRRTGSPWRRSRPPPTRRSGCPRRSRDSSAG